MQGWHACRWDDAIRHISDELWVCELDGRIVEGSDKVVGERLRLVERVSAIDDRTLRLFAADVAEMVLPIFEAKYPSDDRPRKAIEAARRCADTDTATSAAAYAAYAAAYAAHAAHTADTATAAAAYAARAAHAAYDARAAAAYATGAYAAYAAATVAAAYATGAAFTATATERLLGHYAQLDPNRFTRKEHA